MCGFPGPGNHRKKVLYPFFAPVSPANIELPGTPSSFEVINSFSFLGSFFYICEWPLRCMKSRACVFLLLFFASCVSYRAKESLDQAEALLDMAPDSALAIVNSIPRKALSNPSVRARHALLLTQAQDKNYLDIAEDSTIRIAYDWYKRYGSKQNRLKSTYYLGVIRQNAGNNIDAAICFREAEPLAEALKEYRLQSLCNQHLSAIYSSNYDRLSAMYYAEQSLKSADLSKDMLMADYCRLDIADQFIAQNQLDTAEVILKSIILDAKDSILLSYACRSLAKLYLIKPKPNYSEAKSLLESAFSGKSIPISSQDFAFWGLMAEYGGDSLLADRYCLEAEKTMLSSVDSVSYFITQTNIFEVRGDYRKSYSSYGKAMVIQDRIVYAQLEQSITHAMENYFQNQADLEKAKGRFRMLVFLLLTILLIGIIAWLSGRLHWAKMEIIEKMAQIQDFSSDLEYLQSKDSASRVLLDFYTKDKIKSLNSLANAYFSWDSETIRRKEKQIGNHTKEELVDLFQKQLEGFRKNDGFYSSLEDSLNISYDNIMVRAREELKTVRNVDFDLVILFFSGFSAKSVCFLKDMTEASVRMRKTRLKHYFSELPSRRGVDFVKILEHKDS